MAQNDGMMRLFIGLNTIGQQFCQECMQATTPSTSESGPQPDRVGEAQLRAARHAVDEALALQHSVVERWQQELPDDTALWSAPRGMLTAADTAIEVRSALWHIWFDSLEASGRQGLQALREIIPPDTIAESKAQEATDAQGSTTGGHAEATRPAKKTSSQKRSSAPAAI